MTTIRAAFYARVSSEQQVTAHTIESQISALSERARRDGTPVPPERHFVDDGISGATLVRPALDRLRDLAAVGAIDRIYVHSPDRLARNYAYQVLLLDEWRRANVELVFLNRSLGQSPEDDLLLQMQGIIAEYERAKFMERSRRGKRHAAQSGSVNVMSCAPFGYRYVSVREGGGKARFEPNDVQAGVVQRIFTWIGHDRCSLHEVCRRLQKAGELTASGRRVWSKQAVWHILQNPAYVGRAAYGKTHMMPRNRKTRPRPPRGRPAEPRRSNTPIAVDSKEWVFVPVPPLVDERLFRAAQEQLEENRTRARLGGVDSDTYCRDLPAVQPVGMPIMARPLARAGPAIVRRIICIIDALGRTATALGASASAAIGRSRLSFWNRRYGVRSAISFKIPKSWSGSFSTTARLWPCKTPRLSKPGVSNNSTHLSG